MIEVAEAAGASPEPGACPAPGRSAGAMLREAREAAGLHVAALAVSMKVPVAKLDALENDRYDLLPDAVFARALAASICRTLKVDPAPVLACLPQTGKPRLVQDTDGINAPFRSPRDAVAPHWKEQLTRPVSLVVGALLVGAVVVLLWPRPTDQAVVADAVQAAPGPAAPAPEPAAEPEAPGTPAPLTPQPGVIAASVALPAPTPAAAPEEAPAAQALAAAPAAAPAVAAASAAASAPQAAAAAGGVVVFRASAESWIEVRDAKGAVPVRRLLAAGETAGATGAMPLQVTVGNAGATEVQVRGKPFDLSAIARDNVARFEVK